MFKLISLILSLFIFMPASYSWFWFKKEVIPVKEEEVQTPKKLFTVMLNPSDDGREIDEANEQILSWQCAQEMKEVIEKALPDVSVIFSKNSGEKSNPLQVASFANKLKVDLFISMHFYKTFDKPQASLYYFSYNPITDTWPDQDLEGILIPYHKAYKKNIKKTKTIAQQVHEELKKLPSFQCNVQAMPFKPLIGILCPAFSIECGLKKKNDYNLFIKPICDALTVILKQELPEKKDDHNTPDETDTISDIIG